MFLQKIIKVANTAVNKPIEMPDDFDIPMLVPYYTPEIPKPDPIQLNKVLECKIEAGTYVLKIEGTQGDMVIRLCECIFLKCAKYFVFWNFLAESLFFTIRDLRHVLQTIHRDKCVAAISRCYD